jgi:hypothetical protein
MKLTGMVEYRVEGERKVIKITAVIFAALTVVGCSTGNTSTSTLPQASQADASPQWEFLNTDVAIDGTKTVSAEIYSTSRSCTLMLRKRGKKIEVILRPSDFVGDEGGIVRWRIDNGKLHSETWNGSEDGEALFSSSPYVILQAVDRAGNGHTLTVEYPPFEKLPEKVDFALPSSVPAEFQNIAGPIASRDEKIASLRQQYSDCMADNSKTHAECDAIAKKLCDQFGIQVELAVQCQ